LRVKFSDLSFDLLKLRQERNAEISWWHVPRLVPDRVTASC